MNDIVRLWIELTAIAAFATTCAQAAYQFRRAARLRGKPMAVAALLGAPLLSLGLVFFFTRAGLVWAGLLTIALTLTAGGLAWSDRRRWRVRRDYRLGVVAFAFDTACSALIAASILPI
ncbi:hypothetical protein [Qipengyuania sp. 483]